MVEKVQICVRRLPGTEDLPLPSYMTRQAAGMDLFAAVKEQTRSAGKRNCPRAWGVIPAGTRPRSAGADWPEASVTLVNAPGTIDADYRGEIGAILINHGTAPFIVRRGDRIAQMVVHRVCRVAWTVCEELSGTERGDGGFGHTE